MINITHSIWGLSFVLLFLTFWLFLNVSIWVLLLSIYLWQIMDLDLEQSWISKKRWFRSLSKLVQYFSSWHRQETHSIYFSLIVWLLTSPISFYFSIVDWSSFLVNCFVISLWVFSHAFLDMLNIKAIPLFYIPKINPIWKAKYYTWSTFLSNLIENISDYFFKESKKYKSPSLASVWSFIKKQSNKVKFNFWLAVSSENEFKYITLPLIVILIWLVSLNWNIILQKVLEWGNLLTDNILFWLSLLLYSVIWNYFFIENWGFRDFIIVAVKYKWQLQFWKWWDLKKLLWEWNFTKILIWVIIVISLLLDHKTYIDNYWDFFYSIKISLDSLVSWNWNILERIMNFINDLLTYLVF